MRSIALRQKTLSLGTRPTHRAFALRALAIAATASGALAIGALSIGALAIARLAVKKMLLGEVHIRDLRVDRFVGPQTGVEMPRTPTEIRPQA